MKVAKSLGTKVMNQVISPTKEDTLGKVKDLPRRRKLVIKGLQKSFGGKVVYDGFDLELELGTFTSVFGPNGCGKSTLINMISGLMPRDGGSVLYDGRTIEETSISYVFQNYREALFSCAGPSIISATLWTGMAIQRKKEKAESINLSRISVYASI